MQFSELIIKNKERFVQGGILLSNIFLHSSFLMKLLPRLLLLLIYFALSFSVLGIDFSFFKKRVYLIGFFCLFFSGITRFWNKQKQQFCEKQADSSQGGFCCISPCYQKLIEKAMHFPCSKYTIRWESDGRKVPVLW